MPKLMRFHLVFILFALLSATASSAAIVITEVMSSSSHPGGSGNGDWFELYNTGSSGVNLTGWSWDDNTFTPGSHLFGSVTIAPKGFVLVVDENATLINNWANDVWGINTMNVVLVNSDLSGFDGLGTGAAGDAVVIYNAANALVTSVTFGMATTGSSFEWDANGLSLGLSVAGQNGAYVALKDGNDNAADDNPALYSSGSDIASPGSAVPEPSTTAFLSISVLTGLLLRRRSLNPPPAVGI